MLVDLYHMLMHMHMLHHMLASVQGDVKIVWPQWTGNVDIPFKLDISKQCNMCLSIVYRPTEKSSQALMYRGSLRH